MPIYADPLRARIALVVANTYSETFMAGGHGWPALASTAADARRMKSALVSQGFELVGGDVHLDASGQQIAALVRETQHLARTRPGAIVLVYFSGHGFAVDGRDFLVPADATLSRGWPQPDSGVSLSNLLWELGHAAGSTNIVLIDACRSVEGPQARLGALSGERSLPPRTFVGYATTLGASVLASASGQQPSNFASALSDAIESARPVDSLETVYYRVAREVINDTRFQQRPVFSVGSELDVATLVPFSGRDASQAVPPKTEISVEVAQRYMVRRCVWPLLLRARAGGNIDADASAEKIMRAFSSDVIACLVAVGHERPDLVLKVKEARFQNVTAASMISQAAEDGDPEAIFLVGLNDFNNASQNGRLFQPVRPGDPQLAPPDDRMRASGWDNIVRAARMGSPYAAFLAGSILIFGPPTQPGGAAGTFPPRDAKAGAEFLEQAERAGSGDAAASLALAYLSGTGLPQDGLLARKHARLLTQRTVRAQLPIADQVVLAVGLECSSGSAGPKDAACAEELLSWLAERTRAKLATGASVAGMAAATLVQMREPRRPRDVIAKLEVNDAATRYYLNRALEFDDPIAHFYSGLFQERGDHGYPVNMRAALEQYKLAAASGYTPAQDALRRLVQP